MNPETPIVAGTNHRGAGPRTNIALPWWVWVVISVGLAEFGWLGSTVVSATQQSATTITEIAEIQRQQQSLSMSINTLDADVQSLSVNVAVLTQRMADREKRR